MPGSNPAPAPAPLERFCVIGAGPSGLCMAAALRAAGVPYDHFERHKGVGGIWDLHNPGTPMYENAHFVSSRTMSAFRDFPMPEDYPDYPRRDQVQSYLEAFARHHGLMEGVEFGREVFEVTPGEDGADVVVNGERRRYRGVVCASGVNWDPLLPSFPGRFEGQVRHAVSYRSPKEFEGQRVLIVGLGNSGADIACDAVRSARRTFVSVRRGYYFVPKHVFGKPADVFAEEGPRLPLWLERLLFGWLLRLLIGDTTRLGMPKPDHALLESHPLLNDQLLHHLRHGDVTIKPNIERFDGKNVVFSDGTHEELDQVLYATGYSRRIPYLAADAIEGEWAAAHFLTCISRRYPSLFTLGFAELNGALFPQLSRLAALIAQVAKATLYEPETAKRFRAWAKEANFDLTGGRRWVDTPRHAHYCDAHALEKATRKTFRAMGWSCP